MLEPMEKEIDGKTYILSKFPAVAGREIVAVYVSSGLPKIGEYTANEAIMLKLMNYVAVVADGGTQIKLSNRALIDNHVGSWEALAKLEASMMEYNCSFFRNGGISTLFEDLAKKIPTWISKMLTGLSERSSDPVKPPSTS